MTLEEILNTNYSIENLEWCDWQSWIDEIEWPFNDYSYESLLKREGRLEWRSHLSEGDSSGRGRWIHSMCLDGEPIFIAMAAGRNGTEYRYRYIVNWKKYQEMIMYLMGLITSRNVVPLTFEVTELYSSPLVIEDFNG